MTKKLIPALWFLLASVTASHTQELKHTLWIDPRKLDLNQPKVRAQLLNQPVHRLIVSVFENGETLFPNRTDIFPQMILYQGKQDGLNELLKEAHAKGWKVHGYVECLRWVPPTESKKPDLLSKHLKLAERAADREFGRFVDHTGKFASPFNPQVVRILTGVVEEIVERYPALDGLALKCELTPHELLGFSYTARMSYLHERNADVWAIDEREFEPKKQSEQARAWLQWRADKMAGFVESLCQTYRKKAKGKLTLVGPVNFTAMSADERERMLNEYTRWSQKVPIDEWILEWHLGPASNYAGYKHLRTLAGVPRELTVWPILDEKFVGYNPEELRNETKDQEIHALVVRVRNQADLTWLKTDYYKWQLPRVEYLLPRQDLLLLRYDPKLKVRVDIELHPAKLNDLLKVLAKSTKLEFIANRPANPEVYAGISASSVQASSVMEEIATRIKGRWEKTATGYRILLPAP